MFVNSVFVTLGFKSRTSLYELRNGTKVEFRPNTTELVVVRENLLNNIYGRFLREERLGTVVDIGAHKGYFIMGMLANDITMETVLAIEPLRENVEALERNLAMNPRLAGGLGELAIEECAALPEDGTRVLYIGRDPDESSVYRSLVKDREVREVVVRAERPSRMFERHNIRSVDFLKMDIQGSEFDLFDSDQARLLLRTRYLAVEMHDLRPRPVDIPGIITGHGFKVMIPNRGYPDLIFAYRDRAGT